MIKDFRKKKGWNQGDLAEAMNEIFDKYPELKKTTKRNPDGYVDQQTVARIESGEIEITQRYLITLGKIFRVTPNDILGITPKDELELTEYYRNASDEKRKVLLGYLRD